LTPIRTADAERWQSYPCFSVPTRYWPALYNASVSLRSGAGPFNLFSRPNETPALRFLNECNTQLSVAHQAYMGRGHPNMIGDRRTGSAAAKYHVAECLIKSGWQGSRASNRAQFCGFWLDCRQVRRGGRTFGGQVPVPLDGEMRASYLPTPQSFARST
jgi:hypothetical protein